MIDDAPDDGVVPFNCVTLTEAAKRIGVTRQRVHEFMRDGRIDAIQIRSGNTGNKPHYWIRIEDLEAFEAGEEVVMQPDLIRAAMIMIADKHDDASEGARHGLAAVIDDLAETLDDDYLRGLADGLRIKSRSRRVKESLCH